MPSIWLNNVFHSLNLTETILNELDLETASEKLLVDLVPHGKYFRIKYEFNVLGNILFKALKAT